MSGSSRAARTLSRCVVTLDTGLRISWETNPDGSYPGTEYHAKEEEGLRRLIDQHTPAIEELFDEYAFEGHFFTLPGDPRFNQLAKSACVHEGFHEVTVQVASKPEFTAAELEALAREISLILKID